MPVVLLMKPLYPRSSDWVPTTPASMPTCVRAMSGQMEGPRRPKQDQARRYVGSGVERPQKDHPPELPMGLHGEATMQGINE